MKKRIFWALNFLLVTSFLVFSQAHAKRFTSQYCEFELPADWECALEGSEWVCQSTNKDRMKEAIIIMAAKIRGADDSLDKYQDHLKKQKTFKLPGGGTQVSEKKWAKLTTINSHRWIDALHFASEVPGFYTRYLATVKEDIGVVITFSMGKDHYQAYQGVFDKMIASLRVFRQKESVGDFKLKRKKEDLLSKTVVIPDLTEKADISTQQKRKGGVGSSSAGNNLILILLIIGGAAAFIYFKKKKGRMK